MKEKKVTIENEALKIDQKLVDGFENDVKEILQFDEVIIVRLGISSKYAKETGRNVFGLDYQGNIVWQIPEINNVSTPFVEIHSKNDMVHLYNWDGTKVYVNPNTGKLLENIHDLRKGKRPW